MSTIKNRKIWFTISSLAVLASIIVTVMFGLNLGIDFTGGSLLEIEFKAQRPSSQAVEEALAVLNLGDVTVQIVGDKSMILRFQEINEDTHQSILETIQSSFEFEIDSDVQGETIITQVVEEKRFDSIGPTIGQELKQKTIWAIVIVIMAIIFYIAWAFRKVSKPIASWKYGLIAVIALFHDIMITVGIFVVLGQIYGTEVGATFVAALLTILGYSVNDTIVVFDRTRENLIKHIGEEFESIVQSSVNQVITRSINSSLTTLLVLFAILVLGGGSVRQFVLALIIGIAVGTYSSIFLASPLLVSLEKLKFKK